MPANLTPQYREAEKRYRDAIQTEEKIEALEEMIRLLPKHKGTDHLFADLKRRLSKLKSGKDKKKGGSRQKSPYHIPTTGAGMIVLIGLPNAGKSAIIKALTGKDLEVAPYPFTTRLPAPVMMPFENAWVELIDTPPVTADAFDPELVALIKRADLCLFVVDLSDDDVLETVEILAHGLEERRAVPGYTSTPDQGEGTGMTPVKTILVGTRLDLDAGKVNMELLREFIDGRFPVHPLSPETGEGVEAFRVVLWEALDVIRIYPKAPGKKVTREEPMYIHKGGTVIEFASKLHRDFGENLKSARVWGSSLFDGQHVKSSHVLEDGDVVEFSM